MLWAARGASDWGNGLRMWTFAVTSEGAAYALQAQAGRLPALLGACIGSALSALSLVLSFVAIRQFLKRPFSVPWLAAMGVGVMAMITIAGADGVAAPVFSGFACGLVHWLNGRALWRGPRLQMNSVQRVVAMACFLMAVALPFGALATVLAPDSGVRPDMPFAWPELFCVFGLLYTVVTNLGFLQMCKVRAEAEVLLQALTDGLTGLANRRALDAEMVRALAVAARTARPLSVVMVDLDHFKSVNDRFGHRAGDAALVAFARRLRAGLRAQDLAFRYGGEEFLVLLPDTDVSGATVLAGRLRAQVALAARNGMPTLSASLGVAVWRSGDTVDTLLGRADRALYRAKTSGRDRVEVASEEFVGAQFELPNFECG